MRTTRLAVTHIQAITTLAPSRPRTPRSCGFGLEALPLLFDKNPNIPEGFDRTFPGADLSARSDHEPVSSNVTDTPPLADWFLTPCLALPLVCGLGCCDERSGAVTVLDNVWGDETCPFSSHFNIGGDPEVGDPTNVLWDFCVPIMETGTLLSPFSDPMGTGFTQAGGGPTE